MYHNIKNEPFSRKQLIFIIEAAMAAALDKVQGALPSCKSDMPHWQMRETELENYIHGAISHVGIFVPILWAQTEGNRVNDGMGTQEFHGWDEFESRIEAYKEAVLNGDYQKILPEFHDLAESIVDQEWHEYLLHHAGLKT